MLFSGLSIARKSAWTFNTSGTGGLGIEFVAVSGGTVVLDDPSGKETRFRYGAGGGGLSLGIRKIPKIGRLDTSKIDSRGLSNRFSANIAPEPFWNHGAVYILNGFRGAELTREDFRGACIVFDAGAGLIVGYAGSAMLVGINAAGLALAMASPLGSLLGPGINPKGIILSRGWNVGPQASAGVTGQVGYLWPKGN